MSKIDPERQNIWTIKPGDGYSIFDDAVAAHAHGVVEDSGIQDGGKYDRFTLYLVKSAALTEDEAKPEMPAPIMRGIMELQVIRFTNQELIILKCNDMTAFYDEVREAIHRIKARYKSVE